MATAAPLHPIDRSAFLSSIAQDRRALRAGSPIEWPRPIPAAPAAAALSPPAALGISTLYHHFPTREARARDDGPRQPSANPPALAHRLRWTRFLLTIGGFFARRSCLISRYLLRGNPNSLDPKANHGASVECRTGSSAPCWFRSSIGARSGPWQTGKGGTPLRWCGQAKMPVAPRRTRMDFVNASKGVLRVSARHPPGRIASP
jgi:hypothetical protein